MQFNLTNWLLDLILFGKSIHMLVSIDIWLVSIYTCFYWYLLKKKTKNKCDISLAQTEQARSISSLLCEQKSCECLEKTQQGVSSPTSFLRTFSRSLAGIWARDHRDFVSRAMLNCISILACISIFLNEGSNQRRIFW